MGKTSEVAHVGGIQLCHPVSSNKVCYDNTRSEQSTLHAICQIFIVDHFLRLL